MPDCDSLALLEPLFAAGQISISRGAVFDRQPAPVSLDALRKQERIEGMILGLAVGDALGHSSEWPYDPESRWRKFGTIVDHVGTPESPGGRVSDDTQLSLWTLERLLAHGRLDIQDLAACFVRRQEKVVGMGKNTRAALARHRQCLLSDPPAFHACAGDPDCEGRGNGALMRYAPLVLPHLRSPTPRLWTDVTLAAMLTHGHPAAVSSVVAFTHLMWECLRRPAGDVPDPEWWLDQYVGIARDVETRPLPFPLNTDPVPAWYRDFQGTLWEFVDTRVRKAWRRGTSLRDACSLEGFGSRADSVQTVPAVLYVLMSHADSFESAVISAVNDTKDNDTIASIVGAVLGALHGRRVIRARWIEGTRSRCLAVGDDLFADDRCLIEQFAHDAAVTFAPLPARSGN